MIAITGRKEDEPQEESLHALLEAAAEAKVDLSQAIHFIEEHGWITSSLAQRKFNLDYVHASRLLVALECFGIIDQPDRVGRRRFLPSEKQTIEWKTLQSESANRNNRDQVDKKPAPSPGQSTQDRQIRVFISSTFRDMHAERDHLVTVVFPELRERLEKLGLEFFDVDLRWGVPEKGADGETANSWEYCRQWIDRVEPFFVCLLGQRYGWVPEPEKLKDKPEQQRQREHPRSITDMEVRHAVLDARRKRHSYFYLRETEVPLHEEIVAEFVDPPEQLGKLKALKEAVRDCGRPVRDYPCRWSGNGFSDLDAFGRMVFKDLWSGVLRDERYVSKEVWRQAIGADPETDPRYTDESKPVPEDIATKIVALAKPALKDPLDAEREQMERFAESRLRWFQGRDKEIKELTDFIHSNDENALRLAVIAALPGQGKSALMAKLSKLVTQPSVFLITHFVGSTEGSSSAYALVKRLLDELDRNGLAVMDKEPKEGEAREERKLDYNSLCLELAERLGNYAGERRIVFLLDALNQITDGHNLAWMPHRLGPSVRIVVSCVNDPAAEENSPEKQVLAALESRRPLPLRVPLDGLSEADVRIIVREYLREYCKELDTPHVETICKTPQARNPLYLLVMLGELRTLGGNDMNRIVPDLVASMARQRPDAVSLFGWVLERLEVFGAEEVRWWCLYLAAGRTGMGSHELADLLARKFGSKAAATALLIERGLRRYLQRRGGQLDFFHGQLRQAAWNRYGKERDSDYRPLRSAVEMSWKRHRNESDIERGHREIADYFLSLADPAGDHSWSGEKPRALSELAFHLTQSHDFDPAGLGHGNRRLPPRRGEGITASQCAYQVFTPSGGLSDSAGMANEPQVLRLVQGMLNGGQLQKTAQENYYDVIINRFTGIAKVDRP